MNSRLGMNCRENRQSGFSLLEVLIAVVITSIGLLGLAAMQATGLRNNSSAYHRSQATVLAYDIADRMRSNASSMASYVDSEEEEDSGGEGSGDVSGDVGEEEVVDPLAGCKTTGGCSATQLAQNDLAEWRADLEAFLPLGDGSITFNNVTNIYTISVNWDDNRDGAVDTDDPGLQVSFQP